VFSGPGTAAAMGSMWVSKYSLDGGVGGDWYYTGQYDPSSAAFSPDEAFALAQPAP
jgi:hypothetical protein